MLYQNRSPIQAKVRLVDHLFQLPRYDPRTVRDMEEYVVVTQRKSAKFNLEIISQSPILVSKLSSECHGTPPRLSTFGKITIPSLLCVELLEDQQACKAFHTSQRSLEDLDGVVL